MCTGTRILHKKCHHPFPKDIEVCLKMLTTKECLDHHFLPIVEITETYCKACIFYEESHKSLTKQVKQRTKMSTALTEKMAALEGTIVKMKKISEEEKEIARVKQLAHVVEGMELLRSDCGLKRGHARGKSVATIDSDMQVSRPLLAKAQKVAIDERVTKLTKLASLGFTQPIVVGMAKLKQELKVQKWVPFSAQQLNDMEEATKNKDNDWKERVREVLWAKGKMLEWQIEAVVEEAQKRIVEQSEAGIQRLLESLI